MQTFSFITKADKTPTDGNIGFFMIAPAQLCIQSEIKPIIKIKIKSLITI